MRRAPAAAAGCWAHFETFHAPLPAILPTLHPGSLAPLHTPSLFAGLLLNSDINSQSPHRARCAAVSGHKVIEPLGVAAPPAAVVITRSRAPVLVLVGVGAVSSASLASARRRNGNICSPVWLGASVHNNASFRQGWSSIPQCARSFQDSARISRPRCADTDAVVVPQEFRSARSTAI